MSKFHTTNPITVNQLRAEIKTLPKFPYQVAFINLDSEKDPSAILNKDRNFLTIISDRHSYCGKDRIFPINQDENTVFAQYVYKDSKKYKYGKVLDLATGSGVIAMATAKAGTKKVIATDINNRVDGFINKNNLLNDAKVEFIKSDLFKNIRETFDKVTINPPFMPAPKNTFPLHAQGGIFGTENVIEPFFRDVWKHVNKNGCIQGIFHSFANEKYDTVLDLLSKNIPSGWSYEIKHVFPIKNVPIELYSTAFITQKGYSAWQKTLKDKKFKYMRFFMLTIRNDGGNGCKKEELSKSRIYNLIYPPTTLNFLAKKLKTKMLNVPVSENDFPTIGHFIRLSRYNYFVYLTLCNLF